MGDVALRQNRDLLALQRLGGWKTLAMVTRYAHANVGDLAHTIDNLPWSENGGNLRGHSFGKSENSMRINNIMREGSPLHTGEVVGSIPTAPTML